MSLETAIQNLADAISKLADTQGGAVAPKATRTKKDTAAPAADLSAQGKTDDSVTASDTKEPKQEVQAASTAQSTPAAETAAVATGPTKTEVQQAVVKLVTALGRDHAAVVLQPFGAANVSGLDPKHYAAVKATAEKMVADAKAALEVAG